MKHWKSLLCALALAAASLPGAVTAEPAGGQRAEPPEVERPARAEARRTAARRAKTDARRARRQRVKTYDFLGDELRGELEAPGGEHLRGRTAARHTSLIRVRADFVREIGKAAEDL